MRGMEGGMIGDVVRRVADMVDEEAAKACEACRKDMAGRLMPDGLSWPIVDGQPVDFVTGYEPSLGVLEAVSIYSNGACEVMSHDGIIKGVKEIHVEKPKVLDADGVEIHVGDTVCGTRDDAVSAWNRRAERTCRAVLHRVEYQEGVVAHTCSECGEILVCFDFEQDPPKPIGYCPGCGARVIKEES